MLTSVHPVFDVRIFHKQAKTLSKAGYDVTLVAQHSKEETLMPHSDTKDNENNPPESPHTPLKIPPCPPFLKRGMGGFSDEIIDGVKIVALSVPPNRLYRMIVTNLCILRLALKQKGNIYHFHDPELIPIGIILKLLGKKVIYDVHEDLPKQILSKYYIPSWQRKPLAAFLKLAEPLASKVFDYIITATDNIQKKFNKPGKVIVIRNFPILDLNRNINRNIKHTRYNLKLIYAGGLTEVRGIAQIVLALEYVNNNVELILLGKFSPKEYVNKVRRLKGFGKVRYLGKVAFEEVLRYYALAHVGLVCIQPLERYKVSLPIKLFEYMAAGLPVIASDFPLWKKIIDDAGCGICIDPTDPRKIAEAILYLFNNPQLRKQMGENGRKAVLEKYNWEKESEKLLAVYKELSDQGT